MRPLGAFFLRTTLHSSSRNYKCLGDENVMKNLDTLAHIYNFVFAILQYKKRDKP